MAGFYDDVPGHRMAYDRDGSLVFWLPHPGTGGTPNVFTEAERQLLNAEGGDGFHQSSWNTTGYGVIFPELRDITGVAFQRTSSDIYTLVDLHTSPDTTNGVDGTWTSRTPPTVMPYPPPEGLRTGIATVSWTGVKAIKYRATSGSANRFGVFHVYGTPSTGEALDRLRLWHPTLDEEVDGAFFDWGDVVRGTTLERDFRVKNLSGDTANSVSLTMEALTDTTPSNVSQHEFSLDGTTYAASVDVGDLAPGTISATVRLRRTTTSDAALSLWWTRIVASASSYT